MRLMYDSVRPMAIPASAGMVLVYVDGIYAKEWRKPEVIERFKYATKVTCSAIGAVQAQVYDVEPGCIWPMENVLPLVARDWTQGLTPTVYLNQHNHWAAARKMFRERFQREPLWLVANYDGDPTIPDGAIGKQYAHPADPPGSIPSGPWELPFHADVSAVRDYWPGVDAEDSEREEDVVYAFDVQEVPGSVIEAETEIVWPPLNGATGLKEAWVAGFVPAGVEAKFKYAHWNNANGERLDGDGGNYVADDTAVLGATVIAGKRAPEDAVKLVLVYESSGPLKFTVEVR